MRILFFTCLSFLFFCTTPALANLSLDKVIVSFDPDKRPVENVRITNVGLQTLKINTSIIHVINPGQDNVVEEKAKALSAAPKLFELGPGEQRLVRLVLRKIPTDREEIYRVRFTPDKASRTEEQKSGSKSVKVDIITAMGVLIMAKPKAPAPDFKFTRQGDSITFQNNGNVTAHLQRDEYCLPNDASVCIPLPGKRVYPGASWTMTVPDGLKNIQFTQTLLSNDNYTTLTYPAP